MESDSQGVDMANVFVSVWTKGHRVSRDSEEFQLVVPRSGDQLRVGEQELGSVDWPALIEPLYQLTDRDLGFERCLLVDAERFVVAVAGRTTDSRGRPAPIIVCVCGELDWSSDVLVDRVARSHGLAVRLGGEFSAALRGEKKGVGRQLRAGSFLDSREFDVSGETLVGSAEWPRVLAAVRSLAGITGVATPNLARLGANVILGTRHEAETAAARGGSVDGFFDSRRSEIVPLSGLLHPWPKKEGIDQPEGAPGAVTEPDGIPAPEHVEDALLEVEDTAKQLVTATFRLVRRLFWLG